MNGSPTSSPRLAVASLAGVAALVFLGIAGAGGASPSGPAASEHGASRESSDPGLNGGANPCSAFVAQDRVRSGPDLTPASAPVAAGAIEGGVKFMRPSGRQRDAVLVAARIQDKYRPFRESLSSP
jgi:hypothetical protein